MFNNTCGASFLGNFCLKVTKFKGNFDVFEIDE